MFEKLFSIVGIVFFAWVYFFLSSWVIHWAVSLFHPISMTQAFGIMVLFTLFFALLPTRK